MAKPHVAFVGLGIMGSGMARRLLSEGFPLTVYNRNPEKCTPFVLDGAMAATTPREAASGSQIIVSMVANDEASRDVWLGKSGALAGAASGALLIECSTLSTAWIQELSAKTTEHKCRFIDAPVTGSRPQAASGELIFLVGGSVEDIDAARVVFSVLGREILHLGPTGSGTLMKLINNFVCGVQAASIAEALALVDAGRLDRTKALSILTGGAPGSGIVKRVAEKVAANEYTPNFMLRWMAKDISYALREASARNISLQTAAAAASIFLRAVAEGHGDEDFSAVTKVS